MSNNDAWFTMIITVIHASLVWFSQVEIESAADKRQKAQAIKFGLLKYTKLGLLILSLGFLVYVLLAGFNEVVTVKLFFMLLCSFVVLVNHIIDKKFRERDESILYLYDQISELRSNDLLIMNSIEKLNETDSALLEFLKKK